MEETFLSWNVPNWITVVLMAAIGFTLLGFLQKVVSAKMGDSNAIA